MCPRGHFGGHFMCPPQPAHALARFSRLRCNPFVGARVYSGIPIDTFGLDSHVGYAMTRSTSARLMQRVFQQFTSSLGALVLTALAFVASNAHAATPAHAIALSYSHTALNSPEAAARLYSSIRF